MKKRRIALLLMLLVLLPLGLLGWQGLQLLSSSDTMQQVRSQQLVEARLKNVDTTLQAYLQELALDWSGRLPSWPLTAESLRDQLRRELRVKQIFWLDSEGRRQFPRDGMSQAEQRFVERMQMIWDDPQLLYSADDNDRQQEVVSYASKLVTRSQADQAIQGRHGWSVWHWGAGSRLLFWWQAPEGYTLGLEVDTARLKSDLISLLPDTSGVTGHSIHLKDAAGQIIYQWGGLKITNQQPTGSYQLSYPLTNWSLDYFGNDLGSADTAAFGLMILLVSMALVLIGVAIFLYREHTREMRLAAQRVAFVGQVSHELKTPLTNIRMYAEMLEEQLEEEPQQQRYLQVISSESQRLSRLIGNVLNFSREPKIHRCPVEIDQLIQSIVANFQLGFQAKGITAKLDLQVDQPVETDPDQLEQILNNLLSNVEKYAAEGKAVDIRSRIAEGQLQVQVRDYGAGIPAAEHQQIFKPFYRINDRLTEGVSGTGIGLTIARQQVRRLGGELVLKNADPGACFELQIPLVSQS
ncbi:MAG: HAMP domain-containing histidine kinase [Chromatiales bacterium]|nr:HAMP domain-containing histidine kinase [Chromatiales bacterium]